MLVTPALARSPAKVPVVDVAPMVTLVGSSNHSAAFTVAPSVPSNSPDVSTLLAVNVELVTATSADNAPAE